jgi:hypothetical protein
MTVLVDSDILIEVSRGRNRDVVKQWLELCRSEDRVLYSPVTAAELWAGALPEEHRTLAALFAALECVGIDAATGKLAGDYLRLFHRSHHVELGDALIAASAVRSEASLWTRNRKHFPMAELQFY